MLTKRIFHYVVLAGESEMQEQRFTLKNMETGEQKSLTAQDLVSVLSDNLKIKKLKVIQLSAFYVVF